MDDVENSFASGHYQADLGSMTTSLPVKVHFLLIYCWVPVPSGGLVGSVPVQVKGLVPRQP